MKPHNRRVFHTGNPAVIGNPLDRWLCDPFFRRVCLLQMRGQGRVRGCPCQRIAVQRFNLFLMSKRIDEPGRRIGKCRKLSRPTPIEANAQRGVDRGIDRPDCKPFEREFVEVRQGDVGTQAL